MEVPSADAVLVAVEAHLLRVLGEDRGRASITFLGTDRYDVLRYGPGDGDGPDLVRYVTVGISPRPMDDPGSALQDPSAPRCELVLTVRGGADSALRTLGVVAATPAVEGAVLAPHRTVDLGGPLWEGSAFTAVLLGEPGHPVPDLELDPPAAPVQFLPLVPLHHLEAAWARVHGGRAMRQRLTESGVDPSDPSRAVVALDPPAA